MGDGPHALDGALRELGAEAPASLWRAAQSDRGTAFFVLTDSLGSWLRLTGLFEGRPNVAVLGAGEPGASSHAVSLEDGASYVRSLGSEEGSDQLEVHYEPPERDRFQKAIDVLDTLPWPRVREVLGGRIGLAGPVQTLDELGVSSGITRERIRQLEVRGVKALQHSSRRRMVVDALNSVTLTGASLGMPLDEPALPAAIASAFRADADLVRAFVNLTVKVGWRAPFFATPRVLRDAELGTATSGSPLEDETAFPCVESAVFDMAVLRALLGTGDGSRRPDLLPHLTEIPEILDAQSVNPLFSPAARLALACSLRPRGDGKYYIRTIARPRHNRNEWTQMVREAALRQLLEGGAQSLSDLQEGLAATLPEWAQLSRRYLANFCSSQPYLSWAGPSTWGLARDVGLSPEAKQLHTEYGTRRLGIGDEIEALLRSCGDSPYSRIEAHILQRFNVEPGSVKAAIQQDRLLRFVWRDSQVVGLAG